MPNKNNDYLNKACQYWREGQTLEAGRLIFEHLPREARPNWAANILRLVIERTEVNSPVIERIMHIASHPSEWKEAHGAFSLARGLTMKLNKLQSRSAKDTLLLQHIGLAELVAKVAYNATNPVDEFDEDSGWWITVSLKNILDLVGDEAFSRSMWLVICLDEMEPSGT